MLTLEVEEDEGPAEEVTEEELGRTKQADFTMTIARIVHTQSIHKVFTALHFFHVSLCSLQSGIKLDSIDYFSSKI